MVNILAGLRGWMPRSGISDLPLHGGDAPKWLFHRMVKLASAISEIVIDEYGAEELIQRMADPFWFQAFSCGLGFDWHSSGTTTVTCGAMKVALEGHPEICVAGGKGKVSRSTPSEIAAWSERNGLPVEQERKLVKASKMSAKVDSAAIQDGHQLYHHVILFDRHGHWTVVQQGMNQDSGYARRYQWSSCDLDAFVQEPHTGILGKRQLSALDMTARESAESRRTSVDLVRDGIDHLRNQVVVVDRGQSTLSEWAGEGPVKLHLPRDIDWEVLRKAYEFQPRDYEELIGLEGIGPSTVRALALIGELAHGTKPSWKDPVKYSFTVGGKDGVPYPVDRRAMDRSIEVLRAGIACARIGDREKLESIDKLRRFVPPDISF
jgi:hypothetical protein